MPNGFGGMEEAGVQAVIRGLGEFKAGAGEMDRAIKGIGDSAGAAQGPVGGLRAHLDAMAASAGAATIVFGGLTAAGTALIGKTVMVAARNEELAAILKVVGKNAGYTEEQLAGYEKQLRDMNITTEAARGLLTKFIQSEIDLTDAIKLAGAAQDYGRIASMSGSDAADIMTQAIASQNTFILRQFGLTKTVTQVFEEYAGVQKQVSTAVVDNTADMAMLGREMALLQDKIKLNNEELALQIGYWGQDDVRVKKHRQSIEAMNIQLAKMTEKYNKLAGEHGRVITTTKESTRELTDLEKKQAILNYILEEAIGVEGAYEASLSTARGQMIRFKATIDELCNAFGQFFLPLLTKAVGTVADLAKMILALPDSTKQVIASFLMIGTASSGAVAGLAGMFKMAPLLAGALSFLISPLGLLVAAIGALAGAFIMDFGGIRTKVMPILQELATWFQERIPVALDYLTEIWGRIWPELERIINAVLGGIMAIVQVAWSTISDWTEKNWGTIQAFIKTVLNWMNSFVELTIKNVKAIIGSAWAIIREWTEENWPLIQATIQTVLETIMNIVSWICAAITAFWTRWGEDLISIAQTAWNIIKTAIETIIKAILGIIKVVMLLIQGDWKLAWEEVKKVAKTIWEGILEIVELALDKIRELIPRFVAAGKDLMLGLLRGLKAKADDVIEWVKDLARRIIQNIRDLFDIFSPSRVMERLGMEVMAGFIKGLEGMRPALEAEVRMALAPTMQVAAVPSAASTVIQGGYTFAPQYHLTAHYAEMQSPASLKDDLLAMQMLQGARR